MKTVLAIDLGASSGRGILAKFEDDKIVLNEVHRFVNNGVYINNTLYWDIVFLYDQIKKSIVKANNLGGFDSIGIDTWGVDFGLVDQEGDLISNPVHYRDERTSKIFEDVFKKISQKEIYDRTGIQILSFNTIYQLYFLAHNKKIHLAYADKMLLISDLLNYFLTGEKYSEYTNASTTQLLNPHTKKWDFELIEKLEMPKNIFCEIINPGTIIGKLRDSVCEELFVEKADVISVGSHDTASAVLSVPTESESFVYISCGTWSLFGTELDAPLISKEGFKSSYTNEGGVGGKIRYLTNIMGLWLIQESRRAFINKGKEYSFGEVEGLAKKCEPFKCFVDPDYPDFGKPGNIPERIVKYCKETGQNPPESIGEIIRCIYESLALKYKHSLINLEKITGKSFDVIHIVGGGTKDPFLCDLTASACNKKVVAGPVEATTLGNVATQLMATGEIEDVKTARKIIKNSFELKEYAPINPSDWDNAYKRFEEIIKCK